MSESATATPTEPAPARSGTEDGPARRQGIWQARLRGRYSSTFLESECTSELNKYERLLVFADALPPDNAREVAADNVEASLSVLDLTFGTNGRAREELCLDINDFSARVVSVPGWYIYGNIFGQSHLTTPSDGRS